MTHLDLLGAFAAFTLASGFFLASSIEAASQLPPDFKTCKITSDNFDDCLKSAMNDAIPKLKNGLATLGVPPLDPLYIPSMTIGERQGAGAVHVEQQLNNIKLAGTSKSKVVKLDGSKLRDYILITETFTPLLTLQAEYVLEGRILLLPVNGNGNCLITLHNVTVNHESVGEKITKKGVDYKRIKKYKISLQPTKVEYVFENLFNGDKVLGDNINQLLNENWRDVFEDVRPGYEESLGIIFGDYANKIYTKVPYDVLFNQ